MEKASLPGQLVHFTKGPGGGWKDDKRDGEGLMTWRNGSQYEGDFLDDVKHGNGSYTWPNGCQYTGDWD
jgi:hypothetical protein